MKQYIMLLIFVLCGPFFNQVHAGKKSPIPTPTPPPVAKSVCIDPGHGGSETGAINLDLLEKDLNLDVATQLRDKLIPAGYTVFMTREDDRDLSNADRYTFCNAKAAAILLSIHHNGSTDPSVDYSLGLYMKQEDIPLAREVVNTISTSLNLPNRGITRFASGVLLKSNMPSTISEAYFLTNTIEYTLLKTGVRQKEETQALFNAIQNYFD